jgi:hypothetical protein
MISRRRKGYRRFFLLFQQVASWHGTCIIFRQTERRAEMETKNSDKGKRQTRLAGKLSLVGAGMGLTLFAIFGILYGSFLGGVVGLNLAGVVLGQPVEPSVLGRIFVALGMLLGVMVSGTMFIAGGASLGWIVGTAADRLRQPTKVPAAEEIQND